MRFVIVFLFIQGFVLLLLDQPLICECGYIKIWEGVVKSSGNSQHLFDWYSFSHIIHGFIFYGLLKLAFPKMPFTKRLVLAVGIEVSWELIENTPWVINAYRQQALAQGYTGDSVINSLSDTLLMIGGFLFAWKKKVWLTVTLALFFEIWSAYMIRDNLMFNVLNFIYPFEFINNWQNGF